MPDLGCITAVFRHQSSCSNTIYKLCVINHYSNIFTCWLDQSHEMEAVYRAHPHLILTQLQDLDITLRWIYVSPNYYIWSGRPASLPDPCRCKNCARSTCSCFLAEKLMQSVALFVNVERNAKTLYLSNTNYYIQSQPFGRIVEFDY